MKNKGLIIVISIVAAVALICAGIFIAGSLMKKSTPETSETTGVTYYVTGDHVPVFSEDDENSTIITYLNTGDTVLVLSYGSLFSYICTADGQYGYIQNDYISQDYPTVTTTTTTEATTVETAPQYPDDVFGLIVHDKYVNLDTDIDEICSAFNETFSSDSYEDTVYYVSESYMTNISADASGKADSILSYVDGVSIPEGIELGDLREEVLSTLGTPYCVQGTMFILENGQTVEYSLEDYLHGDVVGGKPYGDICDYVFYYVKGDTVLGIEWQIPGSVDPNAVVVGFSLTSLEKFNSYNLENNEHAFFP